MVGLGMSGIKNFGVSRSWEERHKAKRSDNYFHLPFDGCHLSFDETTFILGGAH